MMEITYLQYYAAFIIGALWFVIFKETPPCSWKGGIIRIINDATRKEEIKTVIDFNNHTVIKVKG